MVLPLFPLGAVLYPGLVMPLHIFEQRYRRLVRALVKVEQHFRRFGVIAIKAGLEVGPNAATELHDVGCTGALKRVQGYVDGRFDIVVEGISRFRLNELRPLKRPEDPQFGEVTVLREPEAAPPADLVAAVVRQFLQYRKVLLEAQQRSTDQPPEMPDDVVQMSYLIAAAMVVDLAEKQQLLEADSVEDRLTLELELLRRESAMLSRLGTRPGVELPRFPYNPN